jgi:hypothetical protein
MSLPPQYDKEVYDLFSDLPISYQNRVGDYGVPNIINDFAYNSFSDEFYDDMIRVSIFCMVDYYDTSLFRFVKPGQLLIDIDRMMKNHIDELREFVDFHRRSSVNSLIRKLGVAIRSVYAPEGEIVPTKEYLKHMDIDFDEYQIQWKDIFNVHVEELIEFCKYN